MTEAFLEAIVARDVAMVTGLLSSGISVNKVLSDGRTPLNASIAQGDDVIISLLLAADVDIQLSDSFRVDCARLQPIHYATKYGHLDLIRNFLSCDVDVDQPDEGNCTPLHHACANGHSDVVALLLDEGADINWPSNSGRTPLWKAAEKGHRELVHSLYASGARLDTPNKVGEHVLFDIIRHRALQCIARDLVHLGIDLAWTDIEGNTVLHKACALGGVEAARMIIEAGVNTTAKNDYGNTALHNAAMFDSVSCVVCFLNYGPASSLGALNNVGQSALYLAMVHQKRRSTELLHDLDARLTTREMRSFRQYESGRTASKVHFWQWCDKFFTTPKSLSALCVSVIRNNLRQPIEFTTNSLPLPVCLRKYILLREFLRHDE